MILVFLLSLVFISMVLWPHNIFSLGKKRPGFFFGIIENNGDLFPYEFLPIKDVEDIPLRCHYPIIGNIVRPRDLDCSKAQNIRGENEYFTFWSERGEELFSQEELDPFYIPDGIENIPYMIKDEIR